MSSPAGDSRRGGILLLDKPIGLSSNAALQRVRRAFGGLRGGHSGTLDPLASGMLPICLGEATKVAGEILAGRKCYRFTVRLGEQRSTGDAEGAVIASAPVPVLQQDAVRVLLATLIGPSQQIPPMHSAIKQDGQPLYKLARAGKSVERAPRAIELLQLDLLGLAADEIECRVLCSKGTYVRVLGEDIAVRLGTVGYLSALRREYVEPFETCPMVSLDALLSGPLPSLLEADLAIPQLPQVRLSLRDSMALTQGREVITASSGEQGLVRVYDQDGQFFGLGTLAAEGRLRPRRLYAQSAGNSPGNWPEN